MTRGPYAPVVGQRVRGTWFGTIHYVALQAQADHSWYRVRIQYTHWDTTEHIASGGTPAPP